MAEGADGRKVIYAVIGEFGQLNSGPLSDIQEFILLTKMP